MLVGMESSTHTQASMTAMMRDSGSARSLASGLMVTSKVGMMMPMQTSMSRLLPALPTVVLNLQTGHGADAAQRQQSCRS